MGCARVDFPPPPLQRAVEVEGPGAGVGEEPVDRGDRLADGDHLVAVGRATSSGGRSRPTAVAALRAAALRAREVLVASSSAADSATRGARRRAPAAAAPP